MALGVPVEAQQPKKTPRIGFLTGLSSSSIPDRIEAFRQGLRQLGYVEGNIVIEYRWAEGKAERLPDLAAELVRLNYDRFHFTDPPNFNEGTHLISRKGPTPFQVVPFVF